MPSRQSIPRIHVDQPDTSPSNLPPSGTFDIKDILGQAKLLPKLLAEDFTFDGADDALHFEVGRFQDLPSFPTRYQPPLFILDSLRARLPFPLRPDAFDMGDFPLDEGNACFLLTAPTVPRMQRMMKENLYMQKWVDTLTHDNPPKHIPWTCEKPAAPRKWVAEGSIFPADVVKGGKSPGGLRGATHERSCIADLDRFSALDDQAPHSRELSVLSEATIPTRASRVSHTPTTNGIKTADDSTGIFRGEFMACHTHHMGGVPTQEFLLPTPLPSGSPSGTISSTPREPLAARRGKPLSDLKLQRGVIGHLEYPDIPTAFRGSPTIWSPRFVTSPDPYFTDHENMLLDLRSKCAALSSEMSAYMQEPLSPQTKRIRSSLSVDEWAFARGLATFGGNFSGSIEGQVPKIHADTSIFLPDAFSTPVKGPSITARFGFVHRPRSRLLSRSSRNCSSDPPEDPLPPRPALVNPLTPPHVRSILKKAKNVRFEEITTERPENHTSDGVSLLQASPEGFSTPTSVLPSARLRTPIQNTAKPSSGPAPVKEGLRKNIQKKPALKARPPVKRVKAHAKLEPVPTSVDADNASEPPKSTLVTAPVEHPRRVAHAKENANPTVCRAQAKRKGLSITEIDVRKGIEGTAKSRLSTPLRNIFRFR